MERQGKGKENGNERKGKGKGKESDKTGFGVRFTKLQKCRKSLVNNASNDFD